MNEWFDDFKILNSDNKMLTCIGGYFNLFFN